MKVSGWGKLVLVVGALVGGVWWLRQRSVRREQHQQFDWAREKPDSIANAVRFEKDPELKARAMEDLHDDLAAFQDQARKHMREIGVPRPEGLDPLLAAVLARTDNQVTLVAPKPVVDRAAFVAIADREGAPGATFAEYGESLEFPAACGNGIDDAFQAMLGSQVLYVTYDSDPMPLPHIETTYKVTPGSARYTTKNGRRIFPGVHVTGTLDVVTTSGKLASVALDDEAGDSVEFSTYGISIGFEGGSDNDIAYALVRAACKAAGFRLVEKLTGWKPPGARNAAPDEPASASDVVAACERDATSAGCLAAGTALLHGDDGVPPDPKRAAAMFELGCKADGMQAGDACLMWAGLASEQASKLPWQQASEMLAGPRVATQMACERDLPAACLARGQLELVHGADRPIKPYDRTEALDYEVRACMLKVASACQSASELAMEPGSADTPLWGAAWALMMRTDVWYPGIAKDRLPPLAKKAFGKDSANVKIREVELGADRIFDVTWADWFDLDEGHAVYWIASKSPPEAVRARLAAELTAGSARVYAPSELAYDVRLGMYPDEKTVKTVYGLMTQPPTRLQSEISACGECKGTGSTRYERACRCLPIENATGPSFKTR